ncbi:MAG TPA: hypothetical protein PKJ07_04880 [Bacteroidales bacterium]|jgi:hypothetical protein|nr:hypothetical protein [Bacteroidales bacterium]HOJ25391.1 hypothetical protein [Bacteroidales bacterium]HOS19723.1 hypothetical protein [Bacteroidales bacterium]HOV55205.1 hypothetical protein [Bacteroidales bacterium]HPZ36898.1 hypothetical protein [Bacteroidales bacterium]
MRGIIIVFLSLIFLIGCNNSNNKTKQSLDKKIENEDILNKEIEEKIYKYAKDLKLDSSEFYIVEFLNEKKYNIFDKKDTIVLISFNYCNKDDYGYKGVLFLNNNVVAIFDKNNIGTNFYDKNKIIYIPYTKLNCYDKKVIDVMTLRYKNGKLYEWGI